MSFVTFFFTFSSGFFSRLRTLSALPPQPVNVFAVLAWVGLLVVIVAFAAAFMLKKRRKLILSVTLILVVAIAVGGSVWFLRAQIYYSFDALHDYPKVGDNSFTINCQNNGYVAGSFSLNVLLTNANISSKTNQSYQLVGASTARFEYTLQPGERQNTQVYFQKGENVTDFNLQLQQEQKKDFLMTADSTGNTYLGFVREPSDETFTSQGVPLPP